MPRGRAGKQKRRMERAEKRKSREAEDIPATDTEAQRKKAVDDRLRKELMEHKMNLWKVISYCKPELAYLHEHFPENTFVNLSRTINIKTIDEYLYGHREDETVHFFIRGIMSEWFFETMKVDEACKYVFMHKGQSLPVKELIDEQLTAFLHFASATCLHCGKSEKSFLTDCGKFLCKSCVIKGCLCGCLPDNTIKEPPAGELESKGEAVEEVEIIPTVTL
jgi:hypothetical protein